MYVRKPISKYRQELHYLRNVSGMNTDNDNCKKQKQNKQTNKKHLFTRIIKIGFGRFIYHKLAHYYGVSVVIKISLVIYLYQ